MQIPSFFTRGRRRWYVLVLIIVAVIAGLWFINRSQQSEELEVVRPQVRTLSQVLEFSGVMDASERVSQRFAAGGKLTYVGAQEGDFVKKWQTLASIDARTAQKNLQKQLNAFDSQRLTFENLQDDRKDRVLDSEEGRVAQQDEIALQQAVLGVEIQSIAIEDSRLSSPIEGILVKAPSAVAGTYLAPTDAYEVFNPQTFFFQGYVDEIDIGNVSVGQSAVVRLDAFNGQTFAGTVQKIGFSSLSSSSGGTVFPIEIRFESGLDLSIFRLGMNGEAEVILETRENVLSIPVDAITTREGKSFVQVRTGEKTTEDREIQLGLETEDYAEVISGLSESDEVVLP